MFGCLYSHQVFWIKKLRLSASIVAAREVSYATGLVDDAPLYMHQSAEHFRTTEVAESARLRPSGAADHMASTVRRRDKISNYDQR